MKTIFLLFLILTTGSYSQKSASPDYPVAITESYHSNGSLKIQQYFTDIALSDLKKYTVYYENGQVYLIANFKNSRLHNELTAYWKNGNLKRKDLYKNGILIKGTCWDQNENEIAYFKFEMPAEMIESTRSH